MTMARKPFWHGLALAFTLLLASACGREETKGQIVVALTSNMPIPKDITHLSVQVKQAGVLRYEDIVQIGPNRQPVPTSFTIVRGKRPGDQVFIKVAAWQVLALRQVREVVTTVPANRIAALPIELQWFCDGKVEPYSRPQNASVNSDEISSSCLSGQTCIDGACVDATIDSDTLEDFDFDKIYRAPDADPPCFNVPECFASASQVVVRQSDCSIDAPEGGQGVNVAIETTGDGFCATNNRCFIPLDGFSSTGWTTTEGARLKLTAGACAANDAIKGVAVTTACPTKTLSVPTCAPQ